MKRLFIAIDYLPSERFPQQYAELKKCSCKLDRINWVHPELMHLTIKFLGETSEDRIPLLVSLLTDVATKIPSFQLKLNRIGAFGSRYQPRVIWLGPEELPARLGDLQREMETVLRKHGFPPTYGRFVAHLTLARIHSIDSKNYFWDGIEKAAGLFNETFQVRQFILYESVLQKGKAPQYIALQCFPLKEA